MRKKKESVGADVEQGAPDQTRSEEDTNVDSDMARTDQNAKAAAIVGYFETIHIYRHLISNLQRKTNVTEHPSIPGPRAAAVLARLWAASELGLEPRVQKRLGFDLDINPSDLGGYLRKFLKDGLVEKLPAQSEREKLYQITAEGKKALESWMRDQYAAREYLKSFIKMDPDLRKMEGLVGALKNSVREMLS
jgi:DNA-binding PadR family transcriptional regulator